LKKHRILFLVLLVFGFMGLSSMSFAQPFDFSPSHYIIVHEAIWAPATGGGTWMTEWQITDHTQGGGTVVECYAYLYGEAWRGPFTIWTSGGTYYSYKSSNLLSRVQNVDPVNSDYYGKVGCIQFATQDTDHVIQVNARTYNGNYSKTFNGTPQTLQANICEGDFEMFLMNMPNNTTYRPAMGIANLNANSITVQITLVDYQNGTLGSTFSKTLSGWTFDSFNPYVEAGAPSYSNCWIWINPTAGTGEAYPFGATSNNFTNDPAAHVAIPFDFEPPPADIQLMKKFEPETPGKR
jgi:hypothetical protein